MSVCLSVRLSAWYAV